MVLTRFLQRSLPRFLQVSLHGWTHTRPSFPHTRDFAHEHIWRFPKIGVPPFIIHFRLGFSIVNPPAIGVPPFWETPSHRNYDFLWKGDVPQRFAALQLLSAVACGLRGQCTRPSVCLGTWSICLESQRQSVLLECLASKPEEMTLNRGIFLHESSHSLHNEYIMQLARLPRNVDHNKQPNVCQTVKPALVGDRPSIWNWWSAAQLVALTFDRWSRRSTVNPELCTAQHSWRQSFRISLSWVSCTRLEDNLFFGVLFKFNWLTDFSLKIYYVSG